ncbi:MAG TPA: tRNA (N(6)-L-threonylcarbamoyladenosine(37)-C(2))-methylthiotransferase [Methanospirillum sp.]|nr:tRNA (N(6)-L-threonylcarbamoyladenosine(37)-C(2))-methylthiotransferase [Methanospirillum sp.]
MYTMDTPMYAVGPPSWITDLSGRNVCILTFGCTYNEGDSTRLRSILSANRCTLFEDPERADAIIINSCIVIEKTERKMIRLLHDLSGREVFVTGCLPTARRAILDEFPSVRVIPPDEIHALSFSNCSDTRGPIKVVQIGSGCLGSCTYCLTRIARGRIRSIPPEVILSEIRAAVTSGAVEIRLTGQDLSAYGCDNGSPGLPSLLRQIGSIPGFFRVRLGMMNPATFGPIAQEMSDIMQNEHYFSFLHLPVQSGSDSVLARMGREYSCAGFLEIVKIMREHVPFLSIATDFIAGFPGETPFEFQATMDLLDKIRPEAVNVTRYSYRPDSLISREGELPDRIRKDRSRELIQIGYAILKEQKQMMIGRIEEVLITEQIRPDTVMGRTRGYVGVVIDGSIPLGARVMVEIVGERTHYLTGRICSLPSTSRR